MDKKEKLLRQLLDTIIATGGLIQYEDGTYAPQGEPDWIDMGQVAFEAAEELGVSMPIETRDEIAR